MRARYYGRIYLRIVLLFLVALTGSLGHGGVLIDINHSSVAELKTLPGVRDAYANAIIKNRPYKNKTQLVTRKILPVTVYRQIRGVIIARQELARQGRRE